MCALPPTRGSVDRLDRAHEQGLLAQCDDQALGRITLSGKATRAGRSRAQPRAPQAHACHATSRGSGDARPVCELRVDRPVSPSNNQTQSGRACTASDLGFRAPEPKNVPGSREIRSKPLSRQAVDLGVCNSRIPHEGGACAHCCAGSRRSYRVPLLEARGRRQCALEVAATALRAAVGAHTRPGPPLGPATGRSGRLRGYRDRLGRVGCDALVVRGPCP